MTVQLNKTFTEALKDPTSAEYNNLKDNMEAVLNKTYGGITGFIGVSVTGFREGSIFTDFVVETTEVKTAELAEANKAFSKAVNSTIAPVIGSVTALHNSEDKLRIGGIIYNGNRMRLVCEPRINVGKISSVKWTFRGRVIDGNGRRKITNSSTSSVLTIEKVDVVVDIGMYQCTHTMSDVLQFRQERDVTGDDIQEAPIIVSKRQINVECLKGKTVRLECCVQSRFKVKWFKDSLALDAGVTENGTSFCRTYAYTLVACGGPTSLTFTCKVVDFNYRRVTTLSISEESFTCEDDDYGVGREGELSSKECPTYQVGETMAKCVHGKWILVEDTCVIRVIKELLVSSGGLQVDDVPDFVEKLSVEVKVIKNVTKEPNSISTIVEILGNIADVTLEVNKPVMKDVLQTVDDIIGEDSRESWTFLNANENNNASSDLLRSMELLSAKIVGTFTFETDAILLNRSTFDNSFYANLNNSIVLDIPNTGFRNVSITTITFFTLNNVMPVRSSSFNTSLFNTNNTDPVNAINAAVVLIKVNETIQNVTLSYTKLNTTLTQDPQCVFWNFKLFDYRGGWDSEGCQFVSDIDDTVTCRCDHLTSFSILMSTGIPKQFKELLDLITYVGVGISLASLVICLIIEGYVWKAITKNSTAFMRHVSIINTALSLLIADICFIIGGSIADNPAENPEKNNYNVPVESCSTATFFMHLFYLAVFFWMLVSGLLLFYRTVMVFSHMSKAVMLAIGFLLGYGCPLIIAVVTVAATAPGEGYIMNKEACWLNWEQTKALLAFVIPALTIVCINIIIVIVVLFKMLRRGVGDTTQREERHTLVVILRCVAILTPLFGLTWSLGVGTMLDSTNRGLHIVFALFNSLQGFFILVFGTLLDSKIRSILARKSPTTSTGSNTTRSTSGCISSTGLNWFHRLRGRRNVYRVSEAANSGSAGASESFSNI
ncbi:adhesion G protein-coupled receptor F4-like [Pseudochaenichthys georgianus]|uniref:adhesion G protein-coupled receptor F4-like n=1 Tax=Pseudochaenichthys georgianus TaxID=52239 RepID=UPI00146F2FCF|nr:adhesion G protein-coupled receptor F5-like [Pseudochaenichthys georgianus]